MDKPLSEGARKELVRVLRDRYGKVTRIEKTMILNEFVALTGYHRKHAIQVLTREAATTSENPKVRFRVYDEAVREALVILWEASDRVCGKRLKALIPLLLDSLERHGHLHPEPGVRARLVTASAATIDRLLKSTRDGVQKQRVPRANLSSMVRPQVPVRTFADWGTPAPGFLQVDLVAHGGPSSEGSYVYSITFTDIATGWTECLAMPFRSSLLVIHAIEKVSALLPFPLLGIDVDNGSEFLNEPMLEYCSGRGIVFTRGRPLHKNDQAWVEQKNGAIVRRLLGYERLEGPEATEAVNRLYAVARHFVNFFQPSFKLASKHRQGARVIKHYHPPRTPCERLVAVEGFPEDRKVELAKTALELDPLSLLEEMRRIQRQLGQMAEGRGDQKIVADPPALQTFLKGLSTLWQEGDLKPFRKTRRGRKPREEWAPMGRPKLEAMEMVWAQVEAWLLLEPACTTVALLARLQKEYPELISNKQMRTLQRRVKEWRSEYARQLVFGRGAVGQEQCS
jgi:hypothetical protein